MNFGKWILVSFILFGAFITTLVAVCVREDSALVTAEYYQDELQYQKKLDKMNNANRLEARPIIDVKDGWVSVHFGDGRAAEKGTLKFDRPSNQQLDRAFELSPGQASQQFQLKGWAPGLYRASLSWSAGNHDYYIEKQIVL